ncbi:FAD/NAD(P)-binding protein [Egbenema bharatensis]|uniref:FAD/NAD(P)-binding protein n=1 Tax=Egbenema bharatensis TaxID=3463334 RepID=UPI003A89F162
MERKHSTASTPKTIAIIGGGFSGTMVATHLLRWATYPLSIKLIERRPEVGRGIAYSTPIDSHLLNVPAAKMSAFPDEPDHFLRWLEHHAQSSGDKQHSDTATRFMPRRMYGDYIHSVFQDAVVNAAPMVHLERITAEASALKPSTGSPGEGARIFLDTGDSLYADRVVLALGNFASSVPAPLKSLTDRPQSSAYVREAWSGEATRHLPINAPVLLVGTGLTMADMVVTLRENGHQGQIYAVSRHGLLPQCHLSSHQAQTYPAFLKTNTAPRSIRALLRQVRQEVQTAAGQGQDWRSVVDALRPITQQLWQNLPLVEQKRFLRHVKSYWEVHRHRIAQEIAAVLDQAMQCRQLIDYAGRIQTCQDLGDRVAVTIRHRGMDQQTVLHVQLIINCTGATGHYNRLEHPLVASLQKHQLIQPGILMGIDTASTGAVLDAKGNESNWLYTIGTARKGTLWETTAVPELRIQAQELSQTLLQSVSIQEEIPQPISITSSDNSFIFRQLFDRESCTYTYLIADARSRRALLVDPVLEQVERDLQVLRELDLSLHACLETHVHADHVTGADKLRTFTGCQIIVPAHSGVIGADRIIHDQAVLSLGAVQVQAFATPGHTGSHMAYWVNHSHLLTGDALLIRGCGRTDFQGGNAGMLYETVTQSLFSLPDETLVYPGHDYQGRTVSTIGEEKQWNPRFAGRDRSQFIELMSQLNLPYPQKMKRAVPANQHCGIIEHEQEIEAQKHQLRDIQTLEAANSFIYSGMYI